MTRSRELLSVARDEASVTHQQTVNSRPSLLAFRPSEKAAYNTAVETAKRDLLEYQTALTRNETALNALRNWAEQQIEHWLRNNDEVYQTGLASTRFVEDWKRAVVLLNTRLCEFVEAVGGARNSIVSGYDKETNALSAGGETSLWVAAAAAGRLQSELDSVNKIAEIRNLMLEGTVFEGAPFPLLVKPDYRQTLMDVFDLSLPDAQATFDKILTDTEAMAKSGLRQFSEQVDTAAKLQVEKQSSYVISIWKLLHEYARKHKLDEEKLEEVVLDTEKKYAKELFAPQPPPA
jgi:hypothetical protein